MMDEIPDVNLEEITSQAKIKLQVKRTDTYLPGKFLVITFSLSADVRIKISVDDNTRHVIWSRV
jgi:hypothetical protein